MKAFEQLERLKRMNRLIKEEKTGTPEEFANSLGISRRQLYADLDYLRDTGVQISYSKSSLTFSYSLGHELEISYSFKLNRNRMQ